MKVLVSIPDSLYSRMTATIPPRQRSRLIAKLLEDEQRLKANNLSTRFCPSGTAIFPDQLTVEVTGTLIGYVGDKKISQEQETYQIQFQNNSGRLLVAAFALKPKHPPKEEMEP